MTEERRIRPGDHALGARGLTVGYGRRAVVEDADFGLARGGVTVIAGANGSGKSTLLRTLAGLQRPLRGSVAVDGTPLDGRRPREIAKRLAFLPQAPRVPPGITTAELVAFGRHPHRGLLGAPTAEDRDAVAWAIAAAGIEHLRDRAVDRLSGGERQRTFLAMALAQRTGVLLLDEPTTYLDVRHQLDVLHLVRELAAEHAITVVAVLHELHLAAMFADRILVVGGGRVIADDTPARALNPDVLAVAFDVQAEIDIDERGAVCRFVHPLVGAHRADVPAR